MVDDVNAAPMVVLSPSRRRVRPRGELVNRDDLSLTFLGLTLLHPPRPRFTGTTLHDLYAAMCKNHKFESFESHGDTGATFSTESIRELHIERDRLSIEEQVSVGFDLLKREFADQVKLVQEHLKISGFVEPQIKLRALWPMHDNDEGAADALRTRALKLTDDQYALLDVSQLEGVGLTIRADRGDHDHIYLEVSPYNRDASQLHIELESYSHEQLETPTVLESWLQDFYDYFTHKVTGFIESFMP